MFENKQNSSIQISENALTESRMLNKDENF